MTTSTWRRRTAAMVAAGALALGAAAAGGTAAQAAPTQSAVKAQQALGTKSLAEVLLAKPGGVGFDKDWRNYDIVTAAVLAVLKAKPNSKVSALTNGKVPLTAFLPTDWAFRKLVISVTGKAPANEEATFKAVAGLIGVAGVEAVLLYHVVPGTITSNIAVAKPIQTVRTVGGQTITIRRYSVKPLNVSLWDKDRNYANPRLAPPLDINKGNRQVAHTITEVLRPIDLPPRVR